MTPRTRPHWSRALVKLGACEEAVTWARKQKSYRAAWKKCRVSSWMFWAIIRNCGWSGGDDRCTCAVKPPASPSAIRQLIPNPPKLGRAP